MFRKMHEGSKALDFEEIDDYELASVEQNYSSNSTGVSNDSNNYNYEHNSVFEECQPITFPDVIQLSTFVTPSSLDSESTAVVYSNLDPNASAASFPVKQRLQGKIKEKMRAEGRQDTSLTLSPREPVANHQPTPEEERKALEKKLRNCEAARRSRQKKKEEENLDLMKNKQLTAENEELKREVTHLKSVIGNIKHHFSNHKCVMHPQQDNGDRLCVETGRNKVCNDEYDSSDNRCLEDLLELVTLYPTSVQLNQGSESQQIDAIKRQLQDNQQPVIANTAGVQESSVGNSYNLLNPGKSENDFGTFSIQETSSDSLYKGTNPKGSETGTMAYGSKFNEKVLPTTEICNTKNMGAYKVTSYVMPPVTDVVTQTSSSLYMMKPSKQMFDAWSTHEGNPSEAEEAKSAIQCLCPPPEKKFKLE